MEIIFVRHGQSIQNVAFQKNERYDPNNICLTELGEKQAEITGEYLKTFGKYDVIYSSPLLRVVQTSNIIKNKLGYKNDIIIDDRLEEHNLGVIDEGLNNDEIEKYINKNPEIIQNKLFRFVDLNKWKDNNKKCDELFVE